jgi:hypothetical protein
MTDTASTWGSLSLAIDAGSAGVTPPLSPPIP